MLVKYKSLPRYQDQFFFYALDFYVSIQLARWCWTMVLYFYYFYDTMNDKKKEKNKLGLPGNLYPGVFGFVWTLILLMTNLMLSEKWSPSKSEKRKRINHFTVASVWLSRCWITRNTVHVLWIVRMMTTKKPFKATFFGTPCQSFQYFGLRLAKVYIEELIF